MNTARMKPAQRVACREQASPLSPVAGQSSGRSPLDHGFKGSLPRGFNGDMRLRQRPSRQRSVLSRPGIGVR